MKKIMLVLAFVLFSFNANADSNSIFKTKMGEVYWTIENCYAGNKTQHYAVLGRLSEILQSQGIKIADVAWDPSFLKGINWAKNRGCSSMYIIIDSYFSVLLK